MSLLFLSLKNVWQNRLRAVLTMLGIAITLLAFVLLRTVLTAWNVAADYAAKDRLGIRNKVAFIVPLPKRYIQTIREIPGIKEATYLNWFGGKDPKAEQDFFASMAVDTQSFLSVYDEISVPSDQKEAWLHDRKGALVGAQLAKKKHWKVGDRVTLTGTIFQGDWQFQIDGIYSATRKSMDSSTFFFHWDYLNESVEERNRDQIGWIMARIDDQGKRSDLSQTIDRIFDEKEIQTVTMSERELNLSFIGMVSAILKALDLVSMVILVIVTLILGNTMAMNSREKTKEYATLRAIGFLPKHIASSVLFESIFIGFFGGVLGISIAYPLINFGMGKVIEENLGGFFPYFHTETWTIVLAIFLSIGLSICAGILPAYRASRLNVIEALRKIA